MDQNPPEFEVMEPMRRRRSSRRARAIAIPEDDEIVDIQTSAGGEPTVGGAFVVAAIIVLCIVLIFLTGCGTTTIAHGEIVTGEDYKVSNVHRLAPKLPERIRRLALLPLSCEPNDPELATGRSSLEGVLQGEIDRLNVFEVVRVTPDMMRHLTGQSDWSSNDKLPLDFLSTIKSEMGCDAVLFCRLTRYHAYPPMAVGWSLKMVDTTDAQVWWAADEMFDQADPRVTTASRRYELNHQKYHQANPLLADSRVALISPRRLAQYSVAALFETLPQR